MRGNSLDTKTALKTYIIPVFFLIAVILSPGCKHEPGIPIANTSVITPVDTTGGGGNGGGAGGTRPCSPDTVYFNRDILPILQSNCAYSGCHDAGTRADGVRLDNYEEIVRTSDVRPFNPGKSDLYEVLTEDDEEDRMPPLPKSALSQEQIQLIRKWIMQGAKNNFCTSCDTTKFKFVQDIMPIIDVNCKSCHSGSFPSKGIRLENYGDVKQIAISGQLISVIRWNGPVKMPLSNKLEDCQITRIEKWIANGSPND